MKKNKPRRTPAKAASLADRVMQNVTTRPDRRHLNWYDRISAEQRAVVDEVVRRCRSNLDVKWYVVADSLIATLKIPAKQCRVALLLRELAAKGSA